MADRDVESIREWTDSQIKELADMAVRWQDNEVYAKEARKALDAFIMDYAKEYDSFPDSEKSALSNPVDLKKTAEQYIQHELQQNYELNGLEATNAKALEKVIPQDHELPVSITKKYVITDGKFFDKDDPISPVFKDSGKNLVTSSNDKQVIASMILVAQSKGWDELKISGTKEFRQAAWLEAESLGIKTKGYTPSDKDIALLNDLKERRSINKIEGKGIDQEIGKNDVDALWNKVESMFKEPSQPEPEQEQPEPGQGRFQVVEYLGNGKSRVLLATDSAKEADKVFKAGIDRSIVDTEQNKIVAAIDWVRDGSSPKWEHRWNFDELLQKEASKDTAQDLKGAAEQAKQEALAELTTVAKEHQEIFDSAPPLVQASIAAARNVLNKNIDASLPTEAKQALNDRFNAGAAAKVERGDFKGFPPPLVHEKFKANLPAKETEKDRQR